MQTSTLKNVSEFIRTGKTPPTKETKYFNGDIQWYTPGDLDKDKCLSKSARSLTEYSFTDRKAVQFPAGTLLVACIGDIGKLGITTQVCSSNQQITGVKPNNNTDVNYLYYWFRHSKKVIQHFANNAVVPIINNGTLEQIKIPLPPLPEQQKIAAILDAADQLRQKDQQLIEKYTALSQSLFLEMFGDPVSNPKGWEKSELGSYIEYIGDIGSNGANAVVAKNLVMNDFEDYAIMIRTVNLNSNDFSKNIKYVSKITYDFFAKSKIYGGEIIMNKIGSAGKFWIMPNLKKPVSLGLNQLVIRLKHLNTQFLYYYLSTAFCQAKIESSTRGAVTKSITKLAVKKLPLLYPPIELQNQFAERIQAIEAQKQQAQASLQKSEDLFNSLLQHAFKGELTGSMPVQ